MVFLFIFWQRPKSSNIHIHFENCVQRGTVERKAKVNCIQRGGTVERKTKVNCVQRGGTVERRAKVNCVQRGVL